MIKEVKGNYRRVFYEVNLLVIRIDRNGNYASSMPCSNCIKFMNSISSKIKINKIYYFNEQNQFVCKKLNTINSTHVSLGFRKLKY
jgi:hypothetical protein